VLRNLINHLKGGDYPEFETDVQYYNEDYGGTIIVVSKDPFLVKYSYRDEPVPASRPLYRQKLKDSTIQLVESSDSTTNRPENL
jgi:hypothetical protein